MRGGPKERKFIHTEPAESLSADLSYVTLFSRLLASYLVDFFTLSFTSVLECLVYFTYNLLAEL